MATRRSIWLDPIADGSKVQWDAYGGAANDWSAVAKPSHPPVAPNPTTGIQSTTAGNNDTLSFGNLAGLLDPGQPFIGGGEFVSYLRLWVYIDGAVQPNQRVDVSVLNLPKDPSTGGFLANPNSIVAGSSGWQHGAKQSPVYTSGTMLALTDTIQAAVALDETATQAGFTKITQIKLEVGVSTMDHIRGSGRTLVGASSPSTVYTFKYSQYGSVFFDPWMAQDDLTNARTNIREMVKRGLQMARIFIQFGTMMTSQFVPNETRWQNFERFLDICVDEGLRLDVTGINTFVPSDTGFVPSWLDALSEADRWATFGLWWKRCAQACAGCPAVVVYDIVNEPKVQDGGTSWYDDPGLSYATYLCKNLSGRSETTIATNFYNTMNTEIVKWDLKTLRGYGELGNASVYATLGTIQLPHDYIVNTGAGSGSDVASIVARLLPGGFYYDANKPCIVEEAGKLGTLATEEDVDGYYYRIFQQMRSANFPSGMQMGWRNAAESYATSSDYIRFKRNERLFTLAMKNWLHTQMVGRKGLSFFTFPAVAAGNKFEAHDRAFLYIRNTSGAGITITVPTPYQAFPDVEIEDLTVTIPAGQDRIVGPFLKQHFAGFDGQASVSYTAVTGITVASVRV